MDLVGHGRDEMAKEVGGDRRRSLLVQLNEGELGCPVDNDEEMEHTLLGPHFRDVDVEVPDRVGFELLLRRLVPLDIRQLADAVTLTTAMQG